MECYRTDGRNDARKEIRCQCSQIAFQQKKIKIVRRQKNGKIREGIYRILQEKVIPKPSAKRSQPLTESVMRKISCLWDNAVRHVMKISG